MNLCLAIEGGNRCAEPTVYHVVFVDCEACRRNWGILFCAGHWSCVQHAALLRAGRYQTDYDDVPSTVLDLERISATYTREVS